MRIPQIVVHKKKKSNKSISTQSHLNHSFENFPEPHIILEQWLSLLMSCRVPRPHLDITMPLNKATTEGKKGRKRNFSKQPKSRFKPKHENLNYFLLISLSSSFSCFYSSFCLVSPCTRASRMCRSAPVLTSPCYQNLTTTSSYNVQIQ